MTNSLVSNRGNIWKSQDTLAFTSYNIVPNFM